MENPAAKCSVCERVKEHYNSGIISKSGKTIFVDQNGREWHDMKGKNRRMCPECMDNVRDKIGLAHYKPLPQLKRKCRGCQRVLTLKRYFDCEVCVPLLSEDSDPFLEDCEI